MWPLKTILYFVLFWAAFLAALVNPIWGVMNYLFAYQTHPVGTWWGKPIAALGIRFSLLAAASTVVGMFLGRKRVPPAKPFLTLWEFGVLAMIALGVLNAIVGPVYSHHSKFALEKLWKMLVFVLLLTRLGSDRTHLRWVFWALVLGSLYLGHDAQTAHRSAFFHGRLNAIGGPDFRTTSGLAAHMAAMLPIIGVAFLLADNWKWRVLAAVSAAYTVNAIVLCRTRSAFIGMSFGGLVALLMAPRAKRYRIHLLLIAGGVAAFSLTDSYFWERMNTLTNPAGLQEDHATVSRMDIWKASFDILSDYPLGIGVGNFTSVIGQYNELYKHRSSHNTLLVCFVELGVFGGLLFIAMVAGSLWYTCQATRLADLTVCPLETKLMGYGLLVSLVTYVVTGLGTERFYCESFWWVLAFPLCLYRFARHEAGIRLEELEPSLCAEDNAYVPAPGVEHG